MSFSQVGVDREDRELNLAMTAPRTVSQFCRTASRHQWLRGCRPDGPLLLLGQWW
ncbi:hypothetical protein [Halomonas sp.]|uniref:hypothetical protein n=1 Tax=Halomonas sp. TaxID=1486246 RepID=UPI00384EC260